MVPPGRYVWGLYVTSPVGTLGAGSLGVSCPPQHKSGVQDGSRQPQAALSVQEAAPRPAPEVWEEPTCGLRPPSLPRQRPPWAAGPPSAHRVPVAPGSSSAVPAKAPHDTTPRSCNYECSSRVSGHRKAARLVSAPYSHQHSLPPQGQEPAIAPGALTPGGLGCLALLKLDPCPQVECNSKLDPTTTTFLKVRPSSPALGHPPPQLWTQPCGGACLGAQPGQEQDSMPAQWSLASVGWPLPSSLPSLSCRWQIPGGSPRLHR